jgi:hypothetical protein
MSQMTQVPAVLSQLRLDQMTARWMLLFLVLPLRAQAMPS